MENQGLELSLVVEPLTIKDNFDEIKKTLIDGMQEYELEVTEENLADAKRMATELNKLSNQIESTRKEKEKEFSAPIKAFAAKAKELAELVQTARGKLLDQIQIYDDKIRAICKEKLEKELASLNSELEVSEEFRTANIDGLIIMSNLVKGAYLSKAAKDKLRAAVEQDRLIQDTVKSRLSNLQRVAEMAGLLSLPEALIKTFIREPEATYNDKLNAVIADEIQRQKELEEKIRAQEEKKAADKAEAEKRSAEAEEIKKRAEAATVIEVVIPKTHAAPEQLQKEIDHKFLLQPVIEIVAKTEEDAKIKLKEILIANGLKVVVLKAIER
jgi:hypothetical protein